MNPLLGSNENDLNKTVFSAMRTILSFFGYNTIGTITPMQKIPKPRSSIIDFSRSISTELNEQSLNERSLSDPIINYLINNATNLENLKSFQALHNASTAAAPLSPTTSATTTNATSNTNSDENDKNANATSNISNDSKNSA